MVIKGYIFRKSRLNIVCFGNELSANLRSERFTYKWPEINTTYYWASENLHNTIITGKFKEYHNIEVIRIIEKSTLDWLHKMPWYPLTALTLDIHTILKKKTLSETEQIKK